MFCPNCGTRATTQAKFCGNCGQAFPTPQHAAAEAPVPGRPVLPPASAAAAPGSQPSTSHSSRAGLLLVIGLLLGGFIGFMMRPSVVLIGQLPFGTVLMRGSDLSGLDQLLVPTAQHSFNVMVIGAIVGGASGLALSRIIPNRRT